MARPIPPEILACLEAHQRWLETNKQAGQALAQGNMDLRDLDLSGRALVMTDLPGAKLDRATLCDTNLSDSNFRDASFVGAILDDACIAKTTAWNANFSGANLRNVHGVRLDLKRANLHKANLASGDFSRADFSNANLTYTDLSYAILRTAFFYQARLDYAILTGAFLGRTQLAGATGLELAEAEWIDVGTIAWNEKGEEVRIPKRLEGEAARQWLLAEAAKPVL